MPLWDLPPPLTAEGLPDLLFSLRQAVSRANPERSLVSLLARLTGGYAEVRASWGDVMASAGAFKGDHQTFRLVHGGRHVGRLTLGLPPNWTPIGPIAAEYALLARLQSAAAGAARRRVGERTLEALLAGKGETGALMDDSFAVALATFTDEPGRGAAAQAAHAHALDVLAGAGEGYFAERHLGGFCTVRGNQALWLWTSKALEREMQELYVALTESTGRPVRLGISALHHNSTLHAALDEAAQALASLRGEGAKAFTELDALHELMQSVTLDVIRAQVKAQLAAVDREGRLEALLRAFLNHSGTLEELAGKQRVHVNTLRQRLKVAERAVNGSLHDPATLCRLYLALGPSRRSQELAGQSVATTPTPRQP